ncbi:MAG: site-specific integrase [Muribaculaceae bacterium]|nr:site-specific integrase [Muribaculaceae bacterium]
MPSNLTFRQVAELWKESKRDIVKHSTFCAYSLLLKTHILPVFGNAVSISENDAQQFVLAKLRSGLSRKSVHDIVAILKAIAKFGSKHSIFDFPAWEIAYPTTSPHRPIPVLPLPHHRRLLAELSSRPSPQNIGVMLALCCGLRIGEVCALQWQNVDLQRRIITVAATVSRIYNCDTMHTEHYEATPKTKNSNREIPISPILLNALRAVKRSQAGHTYVVGSGHKAKEPRTYRETFARLLRRLGIPPIVFHGLRHTFATRCIESQCDYKTVSVILGHSNVATTLNLYVHPNIDQKKRCIEKLNRFLGSK